MAATVAGILLKGDHSSRPAASGVSAGTLYACSTHGLIYQAESGSWETWLTPTGGTPAADVVTFDPSGLGLITATDVQEALEELDAAVRPLTVEYVIDGGGAEIPTGVAGDLYVPSACTITGVVLLADQSGDIVVDLWVDAQGSYPPTDADSITASAPPTISGDTDSIDTTLTGWTTALAAGDTIRFNVDSVTDIERVTIALLLTRP